LEHMSRSPLTPSYNSATSSPYRDAAQLQRLLAGVFASPYPGDDARMLTRKKLAVAFSFSDPALEVLLDGRAAQGDEVAALFGPDALAAPPADLKFSMSGRVAHPFWTGELNIVAAMGLGQLQIGGSLIRALSIAPMMPAMQRVYRELWAAEQLGDTEQL
jgi:hypothetical protein